MLNKPLNNTISKKKGRDQIHAGAEGVWKFAVVLWSTVVAAFIVGYLVVLASATDVNLFIKANLVQGFLALSVISRLIILIFIALLIIATLLSLILKELVKPSTVLEWQELVTLIGQEMRAIEDKENDQEGFTHYLHFMEKMNSSISPRGIFQYSRTLSLIDVPLHDTFVHLSVVPYRPIYDFPAEQQRQFMRMEKRTELSNKVKDDQMRRLRFVWYSPLTQKTEKASQPLPIEAVLQKLTPEHPAAVILGAPGSGKTTFLRWLVFSKAHEALTALTSTQASSPSEPVLDQIPLLIQINDYAERLEEEPITLKQFIIAQANRIHPYAATKLLDALKDGRCLILFDGLDENFSIPIRRRVLRAVLTFITEHSIKVYSTKKESLIKKHTKAKKVLQTKEESQAKNFNRFIITSRIADYEPTLFTDYLYYTLLDLDDAQIASVLSKWCYVVERQRILAIHGAQAITEQQLVEAVGNLRTHVWTSLKANLELKCLAASPLALMLMTFLHANGKDLLQSRFDLYQIVTRTLLDTWNRESGRKMFSRKKISLAEELLCHFADRLQNSDDLLTINDIETIARPIMADFDRKQSQEVRENEIARFIETLRRSSGLFGEVGENLFCFANQTFQEYFAVLSLLHKTSEIRKRLIVQYAHAEKWREPLLLLRQLDG